MQELNKLETARRIRSDTKQLEINLQNLIALDKTVQVHSCRSYSTNHAFSQLKSIKVATIFPPVLILNDEEASKDSDKAELFNIFFSFGCSRPRDLAAGYFFR